MKLLKVYKKDNRGLSLIELLVVTGVVIFVLSYGLFLNFDFFRSHYFLSEEKILLNLLRVARNRAQGNIDGTSHGLFVDSQNFILFKGQTFDKNSDENESFPRSPNIIIESTFGSSTSAVVFQNISASVLSLPLEGGEFKIFDGQREMIIRINSYGKIGD